jgi:asparagine synthase (glutamine-hydrolysing)
MSGIAAILNLDGAAVPGSEIERMRNVLKPYGPDRQKILMRRNAAFVFCLHQLTPEDLFEQQPLLFADRFVMLFDGRIDNRAELGTSLGISASDLHSMPDSAIALRLFDRWEEGAFERILGDFVIIVMDLQDGRMVCARDHMGLRVLHFYYSIKQFAVATAPEALFALSWVPRILNKDKVGDTLVRRGLNAETTHYQQIQRVLPGSFVRVRGANISKVRFWEPESIPDVRFKRDDDYVEAFRERLDAAVKVRLRSNRPPCATITGGLDSSSIAVIAADVLAPTGKRLNTFTAVPESGFAREELSGAYFDETPYVRQIATGNSNIIPHFVPPSKEPILEQIAQQIRIGGLSCGILNGLWVIDILVAARSAGHNVMLSGDMGNITMSYHGRQLFTELLVTGRWLQLFREIACSNRWKARVRHHVIAPLIPGPIWRRYKMWRRGGSPPWCHYSAIHPDFAAGSGVVDRAAREHLAFDAPPSRNGKLSRINDFHGYCDAADWLARVRAGFGVDLRVPSFDRRVAEFCLGIPEDQYLRGGRERWLIRRAMKGRLPDAVLDNNRRGVQAADWYSRLTRERNQILKEVNRLAANTDVASIVDLQRLRGILENWPDRQPPFWSAEQGHLQTLPDALGAAYFIENVTGANYGRSPQANWA